MDHKDLLDSVIANMTETTEKAIPDDEGVDNQDNCIRLELSTGETRVIDPEDFDWATAIQHLPEMLENETSFRNMVFGLIHTAGDDSEDTKKFIDNIINQLTEYLKGYNININYRDYNPNISDHDIAMAMLFDANNIARTMSFHTSLYSMMTMLTSPMMTGVDLASNPDETAETGGGFAEDNAVYLVEASAGEGGLSIVNIVATTDYPVDAVDVVDDSGNGGYTVYVSAKDVIDARNKAIELIGMIPVTYEYDDEATSSGLLEDESIYSALHNETTEEVAE